MNLPVGMIGSGIFVSERMMLLQLPRWPASKTFNA